MTAAMILFGVIGYVVAGLITARLWYRLRFTRTGLSKDDRLFLACLFGAFWPILGPVGLVALAFSLLFALVGTSFSRFITKPLPKLEEWIK